MDIPAAEDLQEFLTEHFSPSELRQFVTYLPRGRRLAAALPDGTPSLTELAFATVETLQRHAAIDGAFWMRLRKKRPGLIPRIAAIQASFPALARERSSTLTLVLARASRQERCVEIEVIVRNDSSTPQFLTELTMEAHDIRVDDSPRFKLAKALRGDTLELSLRNEGWSDLYLDLSLEFANRSPARRVGPGTVRSGETRSVAALSESDVFTTQGPQTWLRVSGRGHRPGDDAPFRVDEHIQVLYSDYHPKEITEACPAVPDTVYVSLFDTASQTARKRYDLLREVPPNQADIFACVVSCDRSAFFNLDLSLLATADSALTARLEGLAVVRTPGDPRSIRDGDVFVRGRDGAWHLQAAVRKPWLR